MDRCALFVDAGYLLADGAMAVHGTRHRETVSWDYAGLLQLLGNLARERTGLALLRCYWYEATVEGRRAPEHDALADLPGIKLRLSRIRPGRREGVDTEIHRDLMTLARNGAVADAVVVSGDEDLAPVIADAQDLGVRITVVHVAVDGNWTISRVLRQECDDLIEIGSGHLRPYVNLLAGIDSSSPTLSNGQANGSSSSIAPLHHQVPHSSPPPSTPITAHPPLGGPAHGSGGPTHGVDGRALGSGGSALGSGGSALGSGGSAHSAGGPTHGAGGPSHGAGGPLSSTPGLNAGPSSSIGSSAGGGLGSGQGGGALGGGGLGSGQGGGLEQGGGLGSGQGRGHGAGQSGPLNVPMHSAPPPAPNHTSGPQYVPPPVQPQHTQSPPGHQHSQPQPIGPYTGPQQIPSPSVQQASPTLSDAVKAAHQEGQDFGESVARDAPALWLEAVLARKPRMPSDLEARLLQGSSLPIDFLLHDEVRHALRRGFWDALERSRR